MGQYHTERLENREKSPLGVGGAEPLLMGQSSIVHRARRRKNAEVRAREYLTDAEVTG